MQRNGREHPAWHVMDAIILINRGFVNAAKARAKPGSEKGAIDTVAKGGNTHAFPDFPCPQTD